MQLAHARLAAVALAVLAFAPRFAHAQQRDSTTIVCKDGTTEQGTGGCGTHGGVDPTATRATQAGAKAARRPANTGATLVFCHDGTTSTAGNRACFGHGGVKSEPGARGEVNAALKMEDYKSSVPAPKVSARPPLPAPADPRADTARKSTRPPR